MGIKTPLGVFGNAIIFNCGGAHCLWWVGSGSEGPSQLPSSHMPAAAPLGSSTSLRHIWGRTVTHAVYTLHRSHASSRPAAPPPWVTSLTSWNMKLIKGHSTPEFLTKSFNCHPDARWSTESVSQSAAKVLKWLIGLGLLVLGTQPSEVVWVLAVKIRCTSCVFWSCKLAVHCSRDFNE